MPHLGPPIKGLSPGFPDRPNLSPHQGDAGRTLLFRPVSKLEVGTFKTVLVVSWGKLDIWGFR